MVQQIQEFKLVTLVSYGMYL